MEDDDNVLSFPGAIPATADVDFKELWLNAPAQLRSYLLRKERLDRLVELGAPKIILDNQRRMVATAAHASVLLLMGAIHDNTSISERPGGDDV